MRGLITWVAVPLFIALVFAGCATGRKAGYSAKIDKVSSIDLYVCGYEDDAHKQSREITCMTFEDFWDEFQKRMSKGQTHVL